MPSSHSHLDQCLVAAQLAHGFVELHLGRQTGLAQLLDDLQFGHLKQAVQVAEALGYAGQGLGGIAAQLLLGRAHHL